MLQIEHDNSCMQSHIPVLYEFTASPLTTITTFQRAHASMMEELELEAGLVIDDSSGEESEEGECSSDGEDDSCNLLGIPLDGGKEPDRESVEDRDEMETGSEGEVDEGEKDERDGMEGEGEVGDRIEPEKLMQLGWY